MTTIATDDNGLNNDGQFYSPPPPMTVAVARAVARAVAVVVAVVITVAVVVAVVVVVAVPVQRLR